MVNICNTSLISGGTFQVMISAFDYMLIPFWFQSTSGVASFSLSMETQGCFINIATNFQYTT